MSNPTPNTIRNLGFSGCETQVKLLFHVLFCFPTSLFTTFLDFCDKAALIILQLSITRSGLPSHVLGSITLPPSLKPKNRGKRMNTRYKNTNQQNRKANELVRLGVIRLQDTSRWPDRRKYSPIFDFLYPQLSVFVFLLKK